MAGSTDHIISLVYRSLGSAITEADRQTLEDWLSASPQRRAWYQELAETDFLGEEITHRLLTDEGELRNDLHARIRATTGITTLLGNDPVEHAPSVQRVHFLKSAGFKYAAAIIILFGIGAYLWNNNKTRPKENAAAITPSSSDILPGGQKATLTLADGRTIILDSAQNGQLATENGSEIIKRGDEIIYDAGQIHGEAVVYNTMTTPKGGQYQLTLPDGSKVWLNAASKIIYPTRFIGKTREVIVEGEVYFEVKANAKQPFIVKTNSDEITVLGTEFNVNNYADEPASKISLINGAVKVNEKLLQPGQAFTNGKIITTNIEQDVAWRNGEFNFEDKNVQETMKVISRWYDIEVVYEKNPPDIRFFGNISRGAPLSTVLRALERSKVKFTIEGKKLIVR